MFAVLTRLGAGFALLTLLGACEGRVTESSVDPLGIDSDPSLAASDSEGIPGDDSEAGISSF